MKHLYLQGDGGIFVNGQNTNLKQWQSSAIEYSNLSGQHQLKGMHVLDYLIIFKEQKNAELRIKNCEKVLNYHM